MPQHRMRSTKSSIVAAILLVLTRNAQRPAGGSGNIAMLSLNVPAYTNTETLCLNSLDISVSVGTAISSIRIVYYAEPRRSATGVLDNHKQSRLN